MPVSEGAPRRRVLVIEDSPDGRESLRVLLELWGYQVEVADDGEQGVRKALEWRPDAALVDIGLPLLDGFGVARALRSQLGRSVLLVAITGYSSHQARAEAVAVGFDAYLTKPADPEKIRSLLGCSSNAIR